jgi:IS5 family transposase
MSVLESFFSLGASELLGSDNQLVKLNELLNWSRFRRHLHGIHLNDSNPRGGQKGHDTLKMLKATLLGQWHNLSDRELAHSLRVRIDFMVFSGFELGDAFPDSSTLCRFRVKLFEQNRAQKIFKEVNKQLCALGIDIETTHGAVVDATIISSSNRPKRTIDVEAIAQDRDELSTPQDYFEVHDSADGDARWLKKGSQSYFGYKGFISVDRDYGFIQSVHTTPANAYEAHELDRVIDGLEVEAVYADKGYATAQNRTQIKARKMKSRIMHKAKRGHPLTHWQKQHNRLISKYRYIVEQCFGTLKRRFDMHRARYAGLTKVQGQLTLKSCCFNLLKAVNMMPA